MKDVWDLVADIKAGRLGVLRRELSKGYHPNSACSYTGMTALLGACEAGDLEAVQILLEAGADPNQQHHDGYDPYNSTKSRAVREALLRGGFSLLIDGTSWSGGEFSRRVLAPRPVTNSWTRTLDGMTVTIELCRSKFPPPGGEVVVRIGAQHELRPVAGDHITLPAAAGPIVATIELVDFVGEFQLRIWDEETIATSEGPRSFWLPPWTSD
ncbi:MAG: hypothetical protein H0T46_36070 [Deltaproteobacteria bacterium]|nr:hypothetical protein [Deltaproteobacteria bacterium]